MTPVGSAEGNLDRPAGGVLPEGTAFTATGLNDCTPPGETANLTCEFGVVREGNGNGMVLVLWPLGGPRAIFFESGTPVRFNQSEADRGKTMTVTRESDVSVVSIGEERYFLPDAILYGG
jgi:hypothetical protein